LKLETDADYEARVPGARDAFANLEVRPGSQRAPLDFLKAQYQR
jgi:hypothetical protein